MKFISFLFLFISTIPTFAASMSNPSIGFIANVDVICRNDQGLAVTIGRNLQGVLLLEDNKYGEIRYFPLELTESGYQSTDHSNEIKAVKFTRYPNGSAFISYQKGWGGNFSFTSAQCKYRNR